MMKRGLILLAALLGSIVLQTPAANAAVGGTTSAAPVVLYPDCRDVVVSYDIQPTPDVTHWNMQIDAVAPDGTSQSGAFLSSFFDARTGTFTIFMCGSSMPGTWTISGTGEYDGADGLTRTWQMTPSSFLVRAAQSRTTLTKKSLGRGVYSLKVGVKDERPNGYFATEFPSVTLQKLDHGRWRRIPRLSVSVSDGKASVRVSVESLVKVRAVTRKGSNYGSSTSRPVTLRP
jgi:hypothetical protein